MNPGARDLWFLPLGGCGEIGMNLNLFGHEGAWLMVDCGITFEREAGALRPRIEMPDPGFIAERRGQLAGIVLTHAHEDHIGALPLLWERLGAPVYTTPFTAEVLRRKAAGRGGRLPEGIIECLPGDELSIGPFTVNWVPITHSTPDTCALDIRCAAGRVLHTADWKIDSGPVVGPAFDSAVFQALGQTSLDAIICDSTNALTEGHSVSESAVRDGLRKAIRQRTGRVVVTGFASNVARLASLAWAAERTDRYLGLLGRSLHTIHGAAVRTGLLEPSPRLINAEHLAYLPRHEVLAVATGSQGEQGAALHRLAAGTHPALDLEAGDTMILSARVIPGNEEAIQRMLDRLRARSIEVIDAPGSEGPIHASGHPCRDELAQLYRWVNTRLVVPVHGEDQHMAANAAIARANGAGLALTGRNGDLFYLAPEPGVRRRAAPVGRLRMQQDGTLESLPRS